MNDARLVRPGERVGNLHSIAKRLRDAESPGRDDSIERPPFGVLHDDEIDARSDRMSWTVMMFGWLSALAAFDS